MRTLFQVFCLSLSQPLNRCLLFTILFTIQSLLLFPLPLMCSPDPDFPLSTTHQPQQQQTRSE